MVLSHFFREPESVSDMQKVQDAEALRPETIDLPSSHAFRGAMFDTDTDRKQKSV